MSLLREKPPAVFKGNTEEFDVIIHSNNGETPHKMTLGRIFMAVGDCIIEDTMTEDFSVGYSILEKLYERNNASASEEVAHDYWVYNVSDIKKKLFAMQLITFETVTVASSSRQVWRLTEYGRTQYGLLASGE